MQFVDAQLWSIYQECQLSHDGNFPFIEGSMCDFRVPTPPWLGKKRFLVVQGSTSLGHYMITGAHIPLLFPLTWRHLQGAMTSSQVEMDI
jgi:hypothetical protein